MVVCRLQKMDDPNAKVIVLYGRAAEFEKHFALLDEEARKADPEVLEQHRALTAALGGGAPTQ